MRGGAGTCQEKLQTCPQVKHSIRVPLYVILDMVTGQSLWMSKLFVPRPAVEYISHSTKERYSLYYVRLLNLIC